MNDIKPVNTAALTGAVGKKDNPAELKKALVEFEALFIDQMLKAMRETVMKSDLFHGKDNGEDIYTSLFDAELSRLMARSGGIGLEKTFLKQLAPQYEIQGEIPAPAPAPVKAGDEVGRTQKTQKAMDPGPLRFPIHGRVSSNFGLRPDPFTGEIKFHHGMDIAAGEGTPVYPAAPGKVIFSGARGGYGNVIEVMHENGYVTRYGHNSKNIVKQGDTVNTSEPIGYVGSTGRSTGAHLHFEVLKDGSAVDPGRLFYG